MYSSIQIGGYRGLDSFRLEGLGRINLLVGTNNSGKTSILECIELLLSAGNPYALSSILRRRGEWSYATDDQGRQTLLNVSHIFAGHDFFRGVLVEAECTATADTRTWNDRVEVSVDDPHDDDARSREQDLLDEFEQFSLKVSWTDANDDFNTNISSDGLLRFTDRIYRTRTGAKQAVQFVGTNGLLAQETVRLFEDVVLTENEKHVVQSLRIIDQRIERIASVGIQPRPYPRGGPNGIFVRMNGVDDRVPIGSVGDGMWRMLGLALAIANAKGGALLVDEIDTGLHYSVMGDMWRMVSERAAALDVQVFATTHSRDCYESLAAILKSNSPSSLATIQRIDPSRERAIRFSNDEIVAAAARGIEVR